MAVAGLLSADALVLISGVSTGTLRQARLVIGRVTIRAYTVFAFNQLSQLSLANPPRGGATSTGDDYGHC